MLPYAPKTILLWLTGFLLAFFVSIRVFNEGTPGWKHIITSDGRGYYAYLPALILDGDPSYASVIQRESRLLGLQHYKPGYRVKAGERYLNKYFAGEALLLLPFFLAGTLFSWLFGTPVDGYSFFFQIFIGLGSLFYLVMGFHFLRRLLDVVNIKPKAASLSLLFIFFGTNLFYYSLWQPTMSHVYSFFAINGLLLMVHNSIKNWNSANALRTGFFLGLTILIRPTNAVVLLLIPFLASLADLKLFFRELLIKKLTTMLFIAVVMGVLLIQVCLWIIQTGQLMLWPYVNEGFWFGEPEIFNVLFSYTKGLFVYSPLIFVSLFGLIFLYFRSKIKFISMVVFLVAATYIIASWWCWYYGDGFGLRVFIDYYGIFAILLAMVINRFASRAATTVLIILLTPFVLLNLVQTWQYTHKIMLPNSMNEAKYKHIFLRCDSAVMYSLGGNAELPDYTINSIKPARIFANNFEQDREFWTKNSIIELNHAFSGLKAGYLDSVKQFSPGISVPADKIDTLPAAFFIKGEVMIKDSVAGASNGTFVVLSMDSINPGENWWLGFKLNDVPEKHVAAWSKREFSLMTPVIGNHRGILKVYLWNIGKKPLLTDDFRLFIYAPR